MSIVSKYTSALSRRLASGGMWAAYGTGIWQVGMLISSVVAARVLGSEEFGRFSIAQATISTASVFAGLGLGMTGARYVSAYRAEDAERCSNIVRLLVQASALLSLVFATGLVLAGPVLYASIPGRNAAYLLNIGAVYLGGQSMLGVLTGILIGYEDFKAIAAISIVRAGCQVMLTWPLSKVWLGEGAMLASALSASISLAYGIVLLSRKLPGASIGKWMATDWRDKEILWRFSLPSLVSSTLVVPVNWLASVMLSKDAGLAQMGLFGVANHWRVLIVFLPGMVSQPLLPMLTSAYVAKNRSDYFEALRVAFALACGIAIVLGAGVVLCAPTIARVYGGDYNGAASIIQHLAISAILSSAAAVAGTILASMEKMWVGVTLNASWALILLTVAGHLVKSSGALGLAYSYEIAYGAHCCTTAVVAYLLLRRLPRASAVTVCEMVKMNRQ